jgi:hypothetical protein
MSGTGQRKWVRKTPPTAGRGHLFAFLTPQEQSDTIKRLWASGMPLPAIKALTQASQARILAVIGHPKP